MLLFLAAGAAPAEPPATARVSVRAEAPVITLEGVPPGRHAVDLPTLEYAFEISAECADGGVPESVSINVADTRVTLSGSELAGAASLRLVVAVPGSQTAPLSVDDFCTLPAPAMPPGAEAAPLPFAPAEGASPSLVEVPDVMSAQVALVCSHGEERRMSWSSQPLAVTLACAGRGAAPAGAAAEGE